MVSLLIAAVLIVLGLVIVYFTRKLISTQSAIPVTPIDVSSRPADAAMGLQRDLEPPGIEDAPDLTEPEIQDTLSAVASAIAAKTALLSDEAIDANMDIGRGRGLGDNRRAGLTGSGNTAGPREPGREIRFEPDNLLEYAQWLDYFKIELGVLGRDNKIHYAYNLSKNAPDVRNGEPAEENRLYMNSARGRFAALDRRLASRAGIAKLGRIILQFYPAETQAILYQLENARAQAAGKKPDDIFQTTFRVTHDADRFAFEVEDQTYH